MEPRDDIASGHIEALGQDCLARLIALQRQMRAARDSRGAGDISIAVGCVLSALDHRQAPAALG